LLTLPVALAAKHAYMNKAVKFHVEISKHLPRKQQETFWSCAFGHAVCMSTVELVNYSICSSVDSETVLTDGVC